MNKMDAIVNNMRASADSFHGSANMINDSQMKINDTLADLGTKVSTADTREQSLFENLKKNLLHYAEHQNLLKEMFRRLQQGEMLTEKILSDCLEEISKEQEKFLHQLKETTSQHRELVEGVLSKQNDLFELFLENVTKQYTKIMQEVQALNRQQARVSEQFTSNTILQSSEIEKVLKKQQEVINKLQASGNGKRQQQSVHPPDSRIGKFFKNIVIRIFK
jgi:hypothetical protein